MQSADLIWVWESESSVKPLLDGVALNGKRKYQYLISDAEKFAEGSLQKTLVAKCQPNIYKS